MLFSIQFNSPHFKSDIRKDNRRSHVKLDNILFYSFKKEKNEMKWDENKTLCWIMIWGWMTWKRSLAFNSDDGKKLYNLFTKKIKKIKTNHLPLPLHLTPALPAFAWLCPCNFLWNGNRKKIKGSFSITNQERIPKFVDWFNIHWLHSEL